MVYRPEMEISRPGRALRQTRQWGVGLITTSVGLWLFVNEFQRVKPTMDTALTRGYLVLFGLTGVLILLWIWATDKELDICFEWLDPERYMPPSSIKEAFMAVSLGAVLSLLLYAARDALFYGCVFTAYSAAIIFLYRYARQEIQQAIVASRSRLRSEVASDDVALLEAYGRAVEILERYFLLRPQTARHVMVWAFSSIATVVAFWGSVNDSDTLSLLAYVMLISTITLSEVVLADWRISRDAELRPIAAEINELKRREATARPIG